MADRILSNVSDTARWVAACRAWESARPDALFSDPLAARLAGEQGRAIANLAPRQVRNGWPMIVRTKLIDDLIMASLREGSSMRKLDYLEATIRAAACRGKKLISQISARGRTFLGESLGIQRRFLPLLKVS